MTISVNSSEKKLQKQVDELKNLVEIAKMISTCTNIKSIVDFTLSTVESQLNCSYVALFLQKSLDAPVFAIKNNYRGDFPCEKGKLTLDARHPSIKQLGELNSIFTLSSLKYVLNGNEGIEALVDLKPALIIPLRAMNYLIGVLVLGEKLDSTYGKEYSQTTKEYLLNLAPFLSMALYNTMLLEISTTDMMTKLRMKHYFYTVLFSNLEFSVYKRVALSVLMTDIDFFKKVNDENGHACGDYVLCEVARIVKDNIRFDDMAARYGGEEFVVMLYETDKNSAILIAERIRKWVEDFDFVYEGKHLKVTISIGVVSCQDKLILSAREMVNYADKALYLSKQNGRNRVTFASEELVLGDLSFEIPEELQEI